MEERHRHCTKFVTRGGYIEIFLLFDTASVVVSVSLAATKCHSSMLSKTRQRSVVVFSFFAFLCIVIDFTRSHASTYKDNYVSWSRREMKGGHFIFYKTPRKCTLKWLFGRALHVARNNIIPASFYRLFQQLYWSRLF